MRVTGGQLQRGVNVESELDGILVVLEPSQVLDVEPDVRGQTEKLDFFVDAAIEFRKVCQDLCGSLFIVKGPFEHP